MVPAGVHARWAAKRLEIDMTREGTTMQIAMLLYRLSITFWTGGITLFTFVL